MNQTRNNWNMIIVITALLVALPLLAWAKPNVAININAEKEVIVEENGRKVTKLVPAENVTPGDTLLYTINYQNSGDEAATSVSVVDPIPEGMIYIPGSATEKGEVTFSIDEGKNYKKPSLLTYEVTDPYGKTEKRTASPELYTHVRWSIPAIPAGAKGEVRFRAKVQ